MTETVIKLPPRLERYFKDYATFHKTPGNKLCHYIGIPLIAMTLFGLLSRITAGGGEFLRLDGGMVLLIAAMVWYLFLDWKIALPFGLFSLGLYFAGRAMPLGAQWGLFVLGWIFQGIGHAKYERNRPAFMKNVEHLLIGPLWVFARMVGYAR